MLRNIACYCSIRDYVLFLIHAQTPIYAMLVFDMLEIVLVKRLNFTPGVPLWLIARSLYIAFTMLVGICVPFFGGLLGLFGGFSFASTTYFVSITHSSYWNFSQFFIAVYNIG